MIEKIIELLENNGQIVDWTIHDFKIQKEELYLIGDTTESIRTSTDNNYYFKVYINKERDDEKYTGTARGSINSNTEPAALAGIIDDVVFSASLGLNPAYALPDKQVATGEKLEACDPAIKNDSKACLNEIKAMIKNGVAAYPDVSLASAEIFLSYSHATLYTSKGLVHQSEKTRVMFEMVMLAGNGSNECESHVIKEGRYVSLMELPSVIDRYARYVSESIDAKLPTSKKYDVIFTEEALDSFFNYQKYHTSAAAIYSKVSSLKQNDVLNKTIKGDKLSLRVVPKLKGGLGTAQYDGYGTLLAPFDLIKDSVFRTIAADKRYADYLNCPCTGGISNIEVASGAKSYDDMLADGVLILSRFSSFEPNSLTGAFSGEIRHGLLYKDGVFTPIKGGSVTGMMTSAMEHVYFSKEKELRGSYYGPRYIKMHALDITGE